MPIHLPPTSGFHNLSVQEKQYRELLQQFSEEHAHILSEAYAMAKKAHEGQLRDDGTHYILHPLRATICLIAECDITDVATLAAALLHDVVEDTPLTAEQITRNFGGEISRLVQEVTRPRPAVEEEESIRRDKAKKFISLMDADEKTRLIKCADVLDNVRSWPNIPCGSDALKKLPRWHDEIQHYALPLAQKTHPVLFQELSKAFVFSQNNKNLCVPPND
ncbi:MAG: HD domain-containing protein [Patescibacteria group bacterium]